MKDARNVVRVVVTNPAGDSVAGPESLAVPMTYAQLQSLVAHKCPEGAKMQLLRGDQILVPGLPILPSDDESTICLTVVWQERTLLDKLEQSVLDELAGNNRLDENGISLSDGYSHSDREGDTIYGATVSVKFVLLSDGKAFWSEHTCLSESRCEDAMWDGSAQGTWNWSDAKNAVAEFHWSTESGELHPPSKLEVLKWKAGS
jgi:hypothetical protein